MHSLKAGTLPSMPGANVRPFPLFFRAAVGLLFPAALYAAAPAGIPDPSFGGIGAPPGFAIEAFEPGEGEHDQAYALEETVDGDLLLAGAVTSATPPCVGFMRFSAEGAIDTPFGTGGKICHPSLLGLDFQVQFDDLEAVSLPDGAILIAGIAVDVQRHPFVCRFLADGTKDTGFGTEQTPGCTVLTHVIAIEQDVAPNIAAGAASIVVVANSQVGNGAAPVLTRLSSVDGALQPYGQQNAKPLLPPAAFASAFARDIALAADGDVIAVGAGFKNAKFGVFVSRFDTAEGEPATAFGVDGVVDIAFTDDNASGSSVRLLPTGEALVAGVLQNATSDLVGLAQISSSTGALDPGFNAGVPAIFPLCQAPLCEIAELQIDRSAGGKIFLAGAMKVSSDHFMFAARVKADGTPDAPYGPTPASGISLFESNTPAHARMVLQGRLAVLGGTLALEQDADFALVRLGDEHVFADGFEDVSPP